LFACLDLGVIGLCANLNQITHAYLPVDMSEWVAYSRPPE